jgi:hypothetical protein
MRREEKDKLWWVPFKRWLFSVKSLNSVMGCHDVFRFPWKSVWQTKVLLRLEGGLCLLVGGARKDLYQGQSPEVARHCC